MQRNVDDSYRLLAVRFIRKQIRALDGHMEGAKAAEDVECVHQARVASRRLRAALPMFRDCFPAKHVKKWRKGIRRLTRGLGPARDKDVQIEFVRGALAAVKSAAHRPGVARLLLRLQQQRRTLQPDVIEAADWLAGRGVLDDMRSVVNRMLGELKKRKVQPQSPFVFREARGHILGGLEALLALQDSLRDPDDYPRHHEMRIAAKRLRYTMEICRPAYNSELQAVIRIAKDLQTVLGDIHDCDLWVEYLERFAQEERERTIEYCGNARPFARLQPGIEFLGRERGAHRRRAFDRLAAYWAKLAGQGVWDSLRRTLESHIEPTG